MHYRIVYIIYYALYPDQDINIRKEAVNTLTFNDESSNVLFEIINKENYADITIHPMLYAHLFKPLYDINQNKQTFVKIIIDKINYIPNTNKYLEQTEYLAAFLKMIQQFDTQDKQVFFDIVDSSTYLREVFVYQILKLFKDTRSISTCLYTMILCIKYYIL